MARKPSLDKWFTVAEAAQILECSRNNVHQIILRGRLPHAVKRGNMWLIPASDVEKRKEELTDFEQLRRMKIQRACEKHRAVMKAKFDREIAAREKAEAERQAQDEQAGKNSV